MKFFRARTDSNDAIASQKHMALCQAIAALLMHHLINRSKITERWQRLPHILF
jgi:hypothetical protein